MSLNIQNVVLNMDQVNFLGISIVGHSSRSGDGGIFVANIMNVRFFKTLQRTLHFSRAVLSP